MNDAALHAWVVQIELSATPEILENNITKFYSSFTDVIPDWVYELIWRKRSTCRRPYHLVVNERFVSSQSNLP